jgi:hypothetical protein
MVDFKGMMARRKFRYSSTQYQERRPSIRLSGLYCISHNLGRFINDFQIRGSIHCSMACLNSLAWEIIAGELRGASQALALVIQSATRFRVGKNVVE